MAELDRESAVSALKDSRRRLLKLLVPDNPHSDLSAIVEVKAGVGGSESAIFVGDLMRMYTKLAARHRWKTDVVGSVAAPGVDGFREVLLEVKGNGAYGTLRREAGVHRVQRVPQTETQGRVHSSTAAVIVRVTLAPQSPVWFVPTDSPCWNRSSRLQTRLPATRTTS
jgi:peptide chain release factor 1